MSKWTKLIPDGKGGFDAFEDWNLGAEILYQGAWKLIFGFFAIIFFCAFMPLILMFTYPLTTNETRKSNINIGIIASLFFLLDFWLGGPLWIFFDGKESIDTLGWFAQLNLTSLVLNVFFKILPDKVYESFDDNIVVIILFYIAMFIIASTKIWPLFDGIGTSISETPLWFLEKIFGWFNS